MRMQIKKDTGVDEDVDTASENKSRLRNY